MSSIPLFRPAAVAASRAKVAGDIVLVTPVSFGLLGAGALAVAAAIVAFLVLGAYTRHETLRGQLLPEGGVVDVRAPQLGTIIAKHVAEGDAVARGDPLYVVSSERQSSALGATHERIGRELEARRESLASQIRETRRLEQAEHVSLAAQRTALDEELLGLRAMIEDQRARVALADEATERYERLGAQGFVPTEQTVAKREHALEQRARLASLERELGAAERQRTDLEARLERLPLEYRNRIAELERAISSLDLEIAENEARRELTVVAPASGVAAAVTGEVGQVVDAGRVLLSILPRGAALEAHLYAPSRAVGFVDPGDEVLLRFPAYPYQKFGHQAGTVRSVSRTALAAAERPLGPGSGRSGEPVYRVVVALHAQSVEAYGEPRPLRAGMLVEADVRLETRRLYEWVLEPLYAFVRRGG
ncbi:MAG TPA: HlyD family efflux transporter periplasmic adaptor subunit [Gammaproteobacteria bacterium]